MRRIFYAIILVITGLQCFFPAACVYYAILHPLETVLSATNMRRQLKNSVCTFPMRRTTERATGRLTKMICIQRFSSFIGRFSGRTERPSYFSHLSRIRRPFSPKIVWNLNWGVSGTIWGCQISKSVFSRCCVRDTGFARVFARPPPVFHSAIALQ